MSESREATAKQPHQPKKICFIVTIPATFRSFLLKTAEYLHDHTDWEISLICSGGDDFAKELPPYIRYFPVPMKRGISLSGIRAMRQMKQIFKQERFDLIQYSTPNASLYASLAGWMAKIPVRLYCQWGMAFVGFSGLKKRIFRRIEKTVCRLSTDIEPDSFSNLKFAHAEKLYPESKGSVIFNGSACGIDLAKFDIRQKQAYRLAIRNQYDLPNDAFVFGFVGRITRDKGIQELLSAFRILCEERPAYLMMVGGKENDETIDPALFQWSQADPRVIYTGRTDIVEQYYSAMDVYVLPSYREGFGMGTIEAESMGVPVIVSDIPGPVDAMLDGVTGLLVKKKDVSSLVHAMRQMMDAPDKIASFGAEARKFAEDRFAQTEFYKHLLADRQRLLNCSEESTRDADSDYR